MAACTAVPVAILRGSLREHLRMTFLIVSHAVRMTSESVDDDEFQMNSARLLPFHLAGRQRR
jgi:hypothetical protein